MKITLSLAIEESHHCLAVQCKEEKKVHFSGNHVEFLVAQIDTEYTNTSNITSKNRKQRNEQWNCSAHL